MRINIEEDPEPCLGVVLCISKASLSPGSGMEMCLILAGKAPFLSRAGTCHFAAYIGFIPKL